MRNARNTAYSARLSWFLIVLLAVLVALPMTAFAQDDPIDETTFTSPKFGTVVEWNDNWEVDSSNTSIQVRRDVLALIEEGGDWAVLIELQSQRSYRTGEEFITASMQTYSRLPGYEVVEDHTDQTPPSMVFLFEVDGISERGAGHIQAQPIAGATMVVIVLGVLDELEETKDLVNDEITVNGVPLLEALPVCGAETGDAADAEDDEKSGSTSSPDKTGGFGGSSNDDADSATPIAECVEVFQSDSNEPRPSPTPEPEQTRGDSFNNLTWESTLFPGAELSYNRNVWTLDEELAPEDNFGRDGVILSHVDLPAYIVVEVYDGHNGRAGACIDAALIEASISPGSDELLTDSDGNVIQGSQQGRVWSAYSYTMELESGATDVGGYVECRALPGAAGVLVVTMISRIESFDDAYEDLLPLVRSIRVG